MRTWKKLLLIAMLAQFAQTVPVRAQEEELDNLFEDDSDFSPPTGTFSPPPAMPGNAVPPVAPQVTPPAPVTDFGNHGDSSLPTSPSGGSFGRSFPSTPTKPSGNSLKAAKPTTQSKAKMNFADAQPEDITNENFPDVIESFDYPNADIKDVVAAIGNLTGKNFIIESGVQGKISIIAPTKITVAEAYKAFLTALAMNNFTVVPSGKFLKIRPLQKAMRDNLDIYTGKYTPNADLLVTRIIHFKHTSASEVSKNLRSLLSRDGDMYAYEPTNSVIVTDYGSKFEGIMRMFSEIDRPGFEEKMVVIKIKYAKAKDIADLLDQIINKTPKNGSGFRPGVPSFNQPKRSGPGGTTEELSVVSPDERTNSIIVLGNQAGIEKVQNLVKTLDFKLDPAEGNGVNVYYVKYGDAEKLATTLNGVTQAAGGANSTGGANANNNNAGFAPSPFRPYTSPAEQKGLFDGNVKIQADKNTNSLIITASKQDYEVVMSLLQKIDISRDQVFVEAIIMELNSQRSRDWGATYYGLKGGDTAAGRAGFAGVPLSSILEPSGDKGLVLGFGGGADVNIKVGGNSIKVPSLLGFITWLKKEAEANILSTPNIMALDNEEASISVGERVPTAQTATAATGTTPAIPSIDFQEANIELKLTPHISPDSESIRMKIEQVVASPVEANIKSEVLKNSTTVIGKRTLKTNIVVTNGDTAVLGGLMKDEDSVVENKIPVLGDIPVLGWLFKTNQVTRVKKNLVVFLTPKIVRSLEDSQELLANKMKKRIDWVKQNLDGRDPYGKTIDELPRAARGTEKVEKTKK